jgi:hypothetical protein
MSFVRYVALAALVVWLGGMIILGALVAPAAFDVLPRLATDGRSMAGALFGEILRQFHLVAYLCGGVIFVCLFVMKFVGPPPLAFVPRAAIVATMLALAAYSGLVVSPRIEALQAGGDHHSAEFDSLHQRSTLLMALNLGLGMVLLYWHARE